MRSAWPAILLAAAPLLCRAQIAGVVHDPSGAPVAHASVELAPSGGTALQSSTDQDGRFRFERLAAGPYRLTVSHEDFEVFTQSVELGGKPVELAIALKLASVSTSITVTASTLRNSDPNYQALRKGQLQQVWRVNNLVLKRDAATFTFRSGSFSFLAPVLGHVAVAVFSGDGNLKLTPAYGLAARYLKAIANTASVDEDFSALAVYFTDSTYDEITRHAEQVDESPKTLESVLERTRSSARRRTDRPVSYLETLLGDDDVPNSEADLLAQLYNGETGGFRAFIRGKKHAGLRFIVDPRGALPMMPAPEEVALLNYATLEDEDGIWYLSHSISELAAGHASSSEDHRLIAPERYRMNVAIDDKSLHIAVECALQFRVLRQGARMVRFELLPDLEVASVSLDGGAIPFVQESRRHDGSFYLQFPEKLAKNGVHEVVFHYGGGEYMKDISSRVPLVRPLRPWYPRIDAASRALFDISFRVNRDKIAVSAGKLAVKTSEGSKDVFEWKSDVPIPPAGFQYADYHLTQRTDPKTGYLLEAYLTSTARSMPVIEGNRIVIVTTPAASDDIALSGLRGAVELFGHWFGPLPYGRLAVAESLGTASEPGLIFLPAAVMGGLPVEAYQGGMTGKFERLVDEALPSVASRQWWGGLITPASVHESWLIAGLVYFSAGLFEGGAVDTAGARQHWNSSQFALTGRDPYYGMNLRDAPPVWFGPMTSMRSTIQGPSLYMFVANMLMTRKGGFIIQMLRELMRDAETGDRDFIATMHDFTTTYANRSASTEDFRAIVEKHMKPAMVMDRKGNMQWFFDEWVYGNDIPSYRLDYTVEPAGAGKVRLEGALTQSGVSDTFRMRSRVYARLANKTVRTIMVGVAGNRSVKFEMMLPEEPKEVLLNAEYDVLTEHQEVRRMKTLPKN